MDIEKFKMIDEIVAISVSDGVITTSTKIPKDSTIFDFHFPDFPILPGVMLIEFMAQSAGHLTMARTNFRKMAVLAKVSHCKFYNFVLPGDEIICEVEMLNSNTDFSLNICTIKSNDSVVCSAEIRMKTIEFPNKTAEAVLTSNFSELSFSI